MSIKRSKKQVKRRAKKDKQKKKFDMRDAKPWDIVNVATGENMKEAINQGREVQVIKIDGDYRYDKFNEVKENSYKNLVRIMTEVNEAMHHKDFEKMIQFAEWQYEIFYNEYDYFKIDTKHFNLFIFVREIIASELIVLKSNRKAEEKIKELMGEYMANDLGEEEARAKAKRQVSKDYKYIVLETSLEVERFKNEVAEREKEYNAE